MKKIIGVLFITLILGVTMISCGSSNKVDNIKTKDIVDKIKGEIEVRKTEPIEGEIAKEKYHLDLDKIEEYTIENGIVNSGLETLAVIKVKDGQIEPIKASLQKVLEEKKSLAFYPGEPEAIEGAKIIEKGNYIGLFIIPDYEEGQNNSQKASEIFESFFK